MSGINKLITILGLTATGKTTFATHLAKVIDAEIISADSRQVYRGMDIGTGKDIADYTVDGVQIPYHLIDIKDPGYEYSVYEYQRDFLKAYNEIIDRNKKVIQCGGTGLYLSAVLKAYDLVEVPDNKKLRTKFVDLPHEDLIQLLKKLGKPHNETDTQDRKRLLRTIEIETYRKEHPDRPKFPKFEHIVFGVQLDRDIVKKRITERLKIRLEEGMIDEVKNLLSNGVTSDQLMFYGLEYRYVTQHVKREISYHEMFQKLNTAIHQFSKRQMTWYRRLEKQGFEIHWIDGLLTIEEKVKQAIQEIKKSDF
jgi:tRNA dimethylallyltransferase